MRRIRWLHLLLVICLCVNSLPVHAQSQPADGDDYTYSDCSALDQAALRAEIERTAQSVLDEQSGGIQIDELVARKWLELETDVVIEQEVAKAVAKVANEEGYLSRLWSAWSAEKAEEFATRIANDAFGSAIFTQQIDNLSNAIGNEIAQEMQADFARAASAAFLCLKAYVGTAYSDQLFAAFENKVSLEVAEAEVTSDVQVSVQPADMHIAGLSGVGVIVVTEVTRRITQKLSTRIAERVAGRIATRILGRAGSSLIPIAGWVIGIGLIVWDLWEGGKGALPQIEEALTSEEVKTKIRSEISDSIKSGLPDETAVVSLELAVTLIEQWDNFCGRYVNLCAVAEADPALRTILNDTPLDRLDQLAGLVDTFMEYAGRADLDQALASGQFEALLALGEPAITLLQATRSATTTLAWITLAGGAVVTLVESGLYRQHAPTDFDPALLAAVLAVDNQAAIDKLSALNRDELTQLVAFAGPSLRTMALNMTLDELRQLLNYLQAPPPAATQPAKATLASQLANREVTMQQILTPSPTMTATAMPTLVKPTAVAETPASARWSGWWVPIGLFVILLLVAGGLVWHYQTRRAA